MGKTVYKALQSAATATGNGTALECDGVSIIHVQVTGITTATVTFEVSQDGTTYAAIGLIAKVDGTTINSTATANGAWFGDVRGVKFFRARISAYTSGTISVEAGLFT